MIRVGVVSSRWCPLLKGFWLVLSITPTRRSEDHRRCRGLPDAMPVGGFYRDLPGFRPVPPGAQESSMGVSWGAVQNLVAPLHIACGQNVLRVLLAVHMPACTVEHSDSDHRPRFYYDPTEPLSTKLHSEMLKLELHTSTPKTKLHTKMPEAKLHTKKPKRQ